MQDELSGHGEVAYLGLEVVTSTHETAGVGVNHMLSVLIFGKIQNLARERLDLGVR